MKLEIEFKIDGKMLSCKFSKLPDFSRSNGTWKIVSSGKFVAWFDGGKRLVLQHGSGITTYSYKTKEDALEAKEMFESLIGDLEKII